MASILLSPRPLPRMVHCDMVIGCIPRPSRDTEKFEPNLFAKTIMDPFGRRQLQLNCQRHAVTVILDVVNEMLV